MRKIALDIGDARIGVALSDMLGILASPYETYKRRAPIQDYVYFAELIKRQECDVCVLGLPVNMDGTRGERVRLVEEFATELAKHTDVPIVFVDERLTTVSAERLLIEADMRRDKRKQVIDQIAASIILRSYLDGIANK